MSTEKFGRIGVLMGGYSSERMISLKSGHAVAQALTQEGYQVNAIDITQRDKHKIIEELKVTPFDVAFIALHGRLGEDGVIQGILEELGIPYTGCSVAASQKAFNKTIAQGILRSKNISVPEFISITNGEMMDFKEAFGHLKKLPFVVKAACEGSSIGITVVRHPSQWESAVRDALELGPYVIIEKYIKGREVTAAILGQEALPLVEVVPKSGFFDFSAKYSKGMTQYKVPAQLTVELTQKIQAMAMEAYRAIEAEGFARIDVRIDEENKPYILEINTIPGFTETSLFPKAAKESGLSFVALCEKLLEFAYAKKNRH